jgi:hypothetical protein
MKFYEAHAADRDRFEILAFHDAQAKDFATLDAKLKPISKQAWGGKMLPFPILLDATGETIKTWGVHAFPTVVLIDPQGRIVRGGSMELLETKLAEPGTTGKSKSDSKGTGQKQPDRS